MKIKSDFKFSENGCFVETYTPATDIAMLSERAISYGVKIGAIEKAPSNKAKNSRETKAKK